MGSLYKGWLMSISSGRQIIDAGQQGRLVFTKTFSSKPKPASGGHPITPILEVSQEGNSISFAVLNPSLLTGFKLFVSLFNSLLKEPLFINMGEVKTVQIFGVFSYRDQKGVIKHILIPYTPGIVVTNDISNTMFAKTAITANKDMCYNYPEVYVDASIETPAILIKVTPTTKYDLEYNKSILTEAREAISHTKPNLFKRILNKLSGNFSQKRGLHLTSCQRFFDLRDIRTPNPPFNYLLFYLVVYLIEIFKFLSLYEFIYGPVNKIQYLRIVDPLSVARYSSLINIKAIFKTEKALTIHLTNPYLLVEKEFSIDVYKTLLACEDFVNYADAKLVLMRVSFNEILEHKGKTTIGYYTYHPSIAVTNKTTAYQYWLKVKNNIINKFIDNLYENNAPIFISVKVINCDKYKNSLIEETYDKKTRKSTFKVTKKTNFNNPQKRSMHTNASTQYDKKRGFISPIKVNDKAELKPFSTLDIETINHNNLEYPVAISMAVGFKGNPEPQTHFLSIDKSRLKYDNGVLITASLEEEVIKMWKKLSSLLSSIAFQLIQEIDPESKEKAILNVFVHNLGSFDGYFIFKYFTKFFDNKDINTIIDKQNKFITITLVDKKTGVKVKFLDSYRLFPVSLNNLVKHSTL